MASVTRNPKQFNAAEDKWLGPVCWFLVDNDYRAEARWPVLDAVCAARQVIDSIVDPEDRQAVYKLLAVAMTAAGSEPVAVRTVKSPVITPPDTDDAIDTTCGGSVPFLVTA